MTKASASTGNRRPQDRADDKARIDLLDAARRIIARDGFEAATLEAIANDAQVDNKVLYSHFTSKTDLIFAAVAEDLATMAHLMRHGVAQQITEDGPAVEPAGEADAQNETVEQPPNGFAPLTADIVAQHSADAGHHHDGHEDHGETDHAREERRAAVLARVRETLSHTDTATGEAATVPAVQPAPEAQGEAMPRVDAWLERRLRVFERTLADLQSRQEIVEKSVTDKMGSNDDAVRDVNSKISEHETSHRSVYHELRQSFLDLSGRLEAIERHAVHAAPSEYDHPAPEDCDGVEEHERERTEFGRDEAAFGHGDVAHGDGSDEDGMEKSDSYLAAARRAAMAAAVLSEMDGPSEAWYHKFLRRPYVFGVAGAGAVVLLLIMGFALIGHRAPSGSQMAAADATRHMRVDVAGPGYAEKRMSHRDVSLDRLKALAEGGTTHAALMLGIKYLNGEGVAQDDHQAAVWLERAAGQGEPVAQDKLGSLYHDGRGVPKDLGKALHWYEAAAMQGNREAMHNLAVAYAEGWGTDSDAKEAVRWFSRAASFGFVNSQFNLAVLYERGFGVPQSLTEAYKWYAIAAASGDKEAQARVDALKTQLQPDDLKKAGNEAAAFHALPYSRIANTVPDAIELPRT